MEDKTDTRSQDSAALGSTIPIAAAFALIMIAPLLPWPRAAAGTNAAWRVELVAACVMLALAVWALIKRPFGDGFAVPASILYPLIGFVLWSTVSISWAPYPLPAVHHALAWMMYLSVLLIAVGLCASRSGVETLVTAFAGVSLVAGFAAVIDYLGTTDFASAEFALRTRYGRFAELLVTVQPMVWIAVLYARSSVEKWLLIATAVLGWTAVMLSLSKGAALAGVIGFLIAFGGCLVLSKQCARRPVLKLAGVWLALTVAVQAFFYFASPMPATADYFTGNAGNSALSRQHRLLVWNIAGEMIRMHPLTGVGADNFIAFTNVARAKHAARATDVSAPEIAEDVVLERAHNEYLQIFAELGIVGFVLFAAAFGAVKLNVFNVLRRRGRLSPMVWAGIGGMTAFGLSSLVSSFSFRAMQNGVAFMLVFGFVLSRTARGERPLSTRLVAVAIAVCAVLGIVFFGSKAVGEYHALQVESADRSEAAQAHLASALRIDPDNLNARHSLANGLAKDGQYERAASELRNAIDRGLGVTLTYAQLAKFHRQSGDVAQAEKTYAEGVAVFPGSVYMRVEFAAFLESIGRGSDAEYMLAVARRIDAKQANGWYSLIKDGSVAAFLKAQSDAALAAPADLVPGNAVRQYLDSIPVH